MNDVAITVPYGRADEALSLLRKLGAGVYHGETDGKTTIYKTPNLDVSALILHTLDLLDALAPFAAFCEVYDRGRTIQGTKDEDIVYQFSDAVITLGDLRRARAAIAKARGQ